MLLLNNQQKVAKKCKIIVHIFHPVDVFILPTWINEYAGSGHKDVTILVHTFSKSFNMTWSERKMLNIIYTTR